MKFLSIWFFLQRSFDRIKKSKRAAFAGYSVVVFHILSLVFVEKIKSEVFKCLVTAFVFFVVIDFFVRFPVIESLFQKYLEDVRKNRKLLQKNDSLVWIGYKSFFSCIFQKF